MQHANSTTLHHKLFAHGKKSRVVWSLLLAISANPHFFSKPFSMTEPR